MLAKLHIIITLVAALAVNILSLFQDVTFYQVCIRLVIVISIFFLIGLITRIYIIRSLYPKEDELENDNTDDAQKEIFGEEQEDFEDDFEDGMDLEPQYINNPSENETSDTTEKDSEKLKED